MSNTEKVLRLVNDSFIEKGFKLKNRSFQKNQNSVLSFFDLVALAGGFRMEVIYGVYIQKFNSVFSKVLDGRDFKRTIYIRGEVAFENTKRFQRMKLENDSDVQNCSEAIIEIYNRFAKEFFEKNNSLSKILNSLREVDGIAVPLGNLKHSLSGEEAMLMDLFLTRLLQTEVDFKNRCNYYRETILSLSKQYKIEKGIDGAYMHMIEKLDIESDKILGADWTPIRESLADLL
jgi:hypothetical protein